MRSGTRLQALALLWLVCTDFSAAHARLTLVPGLQE
jgi:hypothetical protein